MAASCVEAAHGVVVERLPATGRVATTRRVTKERLKTSASVAAATIEIKESVLAFSGVVSRITPIRRRTHCSGFGLGGGETEERNKQSNY